MIDLRNTCILVRTKEENEMLLKEAEKQGFHWYLKGDCKPLLEQQHFPDILKFDNDKDVVHSARIGTEDSTFHEASELLGTKEMTAREFAEWYANAYSLCENRECSECVLSKKNTKRNESLCEIVNWKDNIDEILEIAASGRITVSPPKEKAIDILEKFIHDPDHAAVNEEFVDALKLAVKKLKEVK